MSKGIRSNKGVSTANLEILPIIDSTWSAPRGIYYEFEFLNQEACTVLVNGNDTNVLDAGQGFEINQNDVEIKSVVIVEPNVSYKWFGKYGA